MYPPISYRTVTSREPIHHILYITDIIIIPAVLPDSTDLKLLSLSTHKVVVFTQRKVLKCLRSLYCQ